MELVTSRSLVTELVTSRSLLLREHSGVFGHVTSRLSHQVHGHLGRFPGLACGHD